MRLKKTNNNFDPNPYLTQTIPLELVRIGSMKDFDKDGYEITCTLERLFYERNRVSLNKSIQKHVAPVKEWYYNEAEHGLVVDHSMLLTRWAFADEAREVITYAAKERPILNKLLGINPKWGIDFSLDWIDQKGCMEVIHIEQDFLTLDEANEAKMKLETLIENTDWEDGVRQLIKRKAEWEHLCSDDHSDYKAQYFGWHRAFDSKKVFSA